MTDDQGFALPSTFGGVIPTPALDRIANNGLRYTNFHSVAVCSATRAALITGRNHHEMGFGTVSETATGFPGYNSIMTRDKATIGKILKDNGYRTSWFGKDHNTPDFQASQAGPFDQWPTGMGFDYFYGFVGGDTNQWQPNLFRNTTQIYPFQDNPGWNLTTAQADDAIDWMKRIDALSPEQPFFVYYVPGGTHAPHHPTPEWIEKISEMHLFDEGWNKLRETIFANQKKLGVIPPDAKLTPWPKDMLKEWDTLSADEKKMFIRQVEVFAAYAAYTDHEIGRVIQAVEDMGKLDNTLIIFISGDNGNSAEGTMIGTPNEVAAVQGVASAGRGPAQGLLRCLGLGPDLSAHGDSVDLGLQHAVLLDQADCLALRRDQAGHGHFVARSHRRRGRHPLAVPPRHRHRADHPGSSRHPCPESGGWPGAETDRGREHGLHLRQEERERAFDAQDPVLRDGRRPRDLPRRLDRQLQGRRSAVEQLRCGPDRSGGLSLGAVQHGQRLDPVHGRRRQNPEKLKEMEALFWTEAEKYQVLPLDAAKFTRLVQPRPSLTAGRNVFTYSGEMTGTPNGDAPSVLAASYNIKAEVEIPEGGAEGMIVTQGGRFGGYGFYLLKGKPVFTWNLLDLERVKWTGTRGALARQARARVRLQVRRSGRRHARLQQCIRPRPQRHRRAQGRRQGGRDDQAAEDDPADAAVGRELRRGRRHPDRRGRQRLPATVQVHRQARQADADHRPAEAHARGHQEAGRGDAQEPGERVIPAS